VLADITIVQWLLAFLMIIVCLLLMGIILLQKGRGGGLAGAFGGGGGTSAFGSKTGDVLTWFTVALAGGFLLLAVVSNYAFDKTIDEKPALVAPDGADSAAPTELDLRPEGTPPVTTTSTAPAATPATATETAAPPTEAAKPATPADEVESPPADASADGAPAAETAPASPEQP
jgi:preprotein translocase subunit SecG